MPDTPSRFPYVAPQLLANVPKNEQQQLAAGWHAVASALQAGQAVASVYVDRDRNDARSREIEALAADAHVSVQVLDRSELDRMASGIRHQGCLAHVHSPEPLDEDGLEAAISAVVSPLILVLDQVQDPHNLGACLRSAAAAGAHAVVVPRDRSAGLTPAARKVAAGGAELVPMARVTNLARALRRLQAAGVWVVGTADCADTPVDHVDLTGGLALVLGSESAGLRHLTIRTCDTLATIPMMGGVASLNVSVAAGICLFEALRQRRVRDRW